MIARSSITLKKQLKLIQIEVAYYRKSFIKKNKETNTFLKLHSENNVDK